MLLFPGRWKYTASFQKCERPQQVLHGRCKRRLKNDWEENPETDIPIQSSDSAIKSKQILVAEKICKTSDGFNALIDVDAGLKGKGYFNCRPERFGEFRQTSGGLYRPTKGTVKYKGETAGKSVAQISRDIFWFSASEHMLFEETVYRELFLCNHKGDYSEEEALTY